MDIHDMGARSEAGNKYLLIIVDRASKFLFAYPLPNKTVENVAKKLLELLLIFGIPLSLPSDPGTEFTAKVVHHLCKWLNVTTDYGSTDHPRAQGAVEKLGRLFHETLQELCKSWPRRWDEYVQPALWLYRTNPDPRLPGKATPFRLLFGRDCRTQMDATSPSPDDDGMDWMDYITSSPTRVKTFVKCRKFAKTYSTAMGREASDESATTQGSDAPLPGPK